MELEEEEETETEVTEVRSGEEGMSTASEWGRVFLSSGSVVEENWRKMKNIYIPCKN